MSDEEADYELAEEDEPLSNPVDTLNNLSQLLAGAKKGEEALSIKDHSDGLAVMLMTGAEVAKDVAVRLLTWNNFPGRSGVKDLKVFRKNPRDLDAGMKALRLMKDLGMASIETRVRAKIAESLDLPLATDADVKTEGDEKPKTITAPVDERTLRQKEAWKKRALGA